MVKQRPLAGAVGLPGARGRTMPEIEGDGRCVVAFKFVPIGRWGFKVGSESNHSARAN